MNLDQLNELIEAIEAANTTKTQITDAGINDKTTKLIEELTKTANIDTQTATEKRDIKQQQQQLQDNYGDIIQQLVELATKASPTEWKTAAQQIEKDIDCMYIYTPPPTPYNDA